MEERGIHPEDRDIEIGMLAGGMAHEEVEGLASGDPPGETGMSEHIPCLCEREGCPGAEGVRSRHPGSLPPDQGQLINFC
jgi:hypothetical protein